MTKENIEIENGKFWVKKVIGNNATSGKVQVPKKLIGQEVYVVVKND